MASDIIAELKSPNSFIVLIRKDDECEVHDIRRGHAKASVLLPHIPHHDQVLQVRDHLVVLLLIVEKVLIEHGVIVILIVILDQFLLLKSFGVLSDHVDVLTDLHPQLIGSSNICVLVLEN